MSIYEFRKEVKARWPHVTITIRNVSFSDLARDYSQCLTVNGDRRGDIAEINALAKEYGILPDGNLRCFPSP